MSAIEDTFAAQLEATLTDGWVREYRFHPERRWRFDFAWPEQSVAVEIEGGLFSNGGHNRGAYIESTMEKYAQAAIMGWYVLRVSPKQVQSGQAMYWLRLLTGATQRDPLVFKSSEDGGVRTPVPGKR